jgi:type II secretory pathway component PulJ
MMVAVGILAMIIVVLLGIFSQTSRALRAANNQTDVLESGRLIMEMMTREVQQAVPTGQDSYGFHFFASRILGAAPLTQRLPGGGTLDNDLEAFFFVIQENTTYKGIGYFVDPAENGVGTLYRFYAETNSAAGTRSFYRLFTNEVGRLPDSPLMHRVADGVTQLEVHVYDADGHRPNSSTNQWVDANVAAFWGEALPAFVEIKLAVLELHLVERIKHMDPAQARAFLEHERRTAQTHLFRQRIPVLAAPRP